MTEIKPHAAHWGYFDAVVENGRVTGIRPFGPDPFPGALIESVPDAVHAAARIDRPHVRKGWLEGRRRGHLRGGDPFVPVSWDQATRLLAEETARVRAEHGPTAIYGGSYGWSSAGRYHHAKTQCSVSSASVAATPPRSPPIPTPRRRPCCRISSAPMRCCWDG
ncbi:molybdopterin-dependent oxidoreductase [Siccirubricoccus deserti]